MKNLLILFVFLLETIVLFGQTNKPEDSKKILEKGLQLYDDGYYKKAITYYDKIPQGDTNYNISIYEKALALLADSAYRQSIDISKEAMKGTDADHRKLMLYIASAYDYLGIKDSALMIYDSLIAINPNDHQPFYEKGVLYMIMKNYDSAVVNFQHSLLRNPSHFRSHLFLGDVYTLQGRLAEGMIAVQASLLMTSNANLAKTPIAILSEIANQADAVRNAYNDKDSKFKGSSFDEIDQIINAKIALNRDYEVGSVLQNDNVIRQLHALMEKIEYDEEDKSFVMQYYCPLMAEIYKKDQFETYMILLFSGYDIESIEKLAKKNKGDLEKVRKMVFPYFGKILATRTLDYVKRIDAPTRYEYFSDADMLVAALKKKDEIDVYAKGKASYYKAGVLAAEGNYDDNGEKDGEWNYYFSNGRPRLIEHYKAGALDGIQTGFYLNGNNSFISDFDNGKIKQRKEYRFCGAPEGILDYKSEKQYVYTSLYYDGGKEYSVNKADGEIMDSHITLYNEQGGKKEEISFKDGKRDGVFKMYYPDGTLQQEEFYIAGKVSGDNKEYYPNGKLYIKSHYTNGLLDGPFEEYNENGVLIRKGAYKKDEQDGVEESYRQDGSVFMTITYKVGVPISATYIGKDKKEIVQKLPKSASSLKVYNEDGSILAEVPYTNGKKTGTIKRYYLSGQLKEQSQLVDGNYNGTATYYYLNGNKQAVETFKDDVRDGAYTSYAENGKKNKEGWYMDGSLEGVWKTYYPNGKLKNEYFFTEGKLNGPDKFYNEDGSPSYTILYDYDVKVGNIQYDSSGKIVQEDSYPKGTGVEKRLVNGKVCHEIPVKYGCYHGQYTETYPDGITWRKGFYEYNNEDSTYESYYPTGQLYISGRYINEIAEGDWIYREPDGQVYFSIPYKKGYKDGVEKTYRMGDLRYEIDYKLGDKDGKMVVYGESSKVAAVLFFHKGHLAGYTYEGKDGKLLPTILVKDGTATVATTYANGNKAVSINFVKDNYDGASLIYYSNGQLAEEKHYKMGQYDGKVLRYYPSGKLQYEAQYAEGDLQGVENTYTKDGELILSASWKDDQLNGSYAVKDMKTGKIKKLFYAHGVPVSVVK